MNKLTHALLLPLSKGYAFATYVRNWLFDKGVLRSESFHVPVISVGNIAVGGTGKTPHVALLCKVLSGHYRVAVLSRGYGRRTRGYLLATPQHTAADIGDEPCLLKRRYPGVTVAVDERRVHGIRQLLQLPEPPEVILLDDAFQHRYVKPSFSILLSDVRRPLYADTCLPAGRLRESFAGRLRADMVLLTKTPAGFSQQDLARERAAFRLPENMHFMATSLCYGVLQPVFNDRGPLCGADVSQGALRDYAVLAVTAIASPAPFHDFLWPQVARLETLQFADHHAFTARDVLRAVRLFDQLSGEKKCLLTTEKDAVRWDAAGVPDRLRVAMYYVPVEVTFPLHDEDAFFAQIAEAWNKADA
ncbi:MAG: tetraacyldisaccharide 4'-kinase [Bacteroidales bacterium]|nr:tetraacyldisaccharide 4'-kinase [Bacteroidales bacterium]MBQ7213466.1 tetraacyldisaccharide 4'-kinase [Bacteroidales bacterium]